MAGKTLYDKIWDAHLVRQREDGTALIYIDRQLIHEVTSPQAFEGLRLAGRKPWRAEANLATPDHNIPTTREERSRGLDGIKDPISRIQVKTLDENCQEFGILELGMKAGAGRGVAPVAAHARGHAGLSRSPIGMDPYMLRLIPAGLQDGRTLGLRDARIKHE